VRTATNLLEKVSGATPITRPRSLQLVFDDRRKIVERNSLGKLLDSEPCETRDYIKERRQLKKSVEAKYADNSLYIPRNSLAGLLDALVCNLASFLYNGGFDIGMVVLDASRVSSIRQMICSSFGRTYNHKFIVSAITRPRFASFCPSPRRSDSIGRVSN